MTVRTAYEALQAAIVAADDAVRELLLAAGDAPRDDQPAVLEGLRSAALATRGDIFDMASSLEGAIAGDASDAKRVATFIARCHASHLSGQRRAQAELTSYAIRAELANATADRDEEWMRWSEITEGGLDRIDEALSRIGTAILNCWEELIDRSGTVSVSSTNIGQNIEVRDPQSVRDVMT